MSRNAERCFLLLLTILLGFVISASAEDAEIEQERWTWEPGETATFTGSFDGSAWAGRSVTLGLDISVAQKGLDIGEVVFTYVNAKKIAVKKQTNQYELAVPESPGRIYFSGAWHIDEAYRNGSITLRLTITEDNGIPETLAVMTADNGRDPDNDTGDYAHWARRIRKAGRYILIAAACAWLLATARAILTFRRRQRR